MEDNKVDFAAEANRILPVMYIFVNNDLKMSGGKIASQVGHAVQAITEEIIRMGYERMPPPVQYFTYMKWKHNCAKIVLRGTNEQLLELAKHPEARHIIDEGQTTQVASGSLTAVGFFPSTDRSIAEGYRLLN